MFSIITGNTFTGNAQRYYDDSPYLIGYPIGIWNSGFTFDNYLYNMSFKYRSNSKIYISNRYNGDLGIGTFDINLGDAKFIQIVNINGTSLNGEYVGFANNFNNLGSSCTSSITIPTISGTTVNFVVNTGLDYLSGITIYVYQYPNGYWFKGVIVFYNKYTGDITIDSTDYSGTGTYSNWYVGYSSGIWFEVDEVNLFRVT